ncbi:MAG: MoaD/ThiS family protein [Pirellulales bacterium]
MSVAVELFGVPRQRAGVAQTTAEGSRLGEVLAYLAAAFPELARTCFPQGRLAAGYLASVNGDRFVTDPATPVRAADRVLILSADAGG